tara:strand:- start:3747 stop:4034 length:288 start_codon:yes stop_codon:yes gene_type:complete
MSEVKNNLKFDSEQKQIIFTSEPYVIYSEYLGYQPVINAKLDFEDKEYLVYLSAKSLSRQLEPIVQKNGNKFTGIELVIFKESDDRRSKYVVEEI